LALMPLRRHNIVSCNAARRSLSGVEGRHGQNTKRNIRRVGEVARLMTDAGLIVLCAFISPFRADRRMVRESAPDGGFIEIFVDTPLDVCVSRDPKGLYKRAIDGQIKNFTGIDQACEVPEQPEIHLDAAQVSTTDVADRIVDELIKHSIVNGQILNRQRCASFDGGIQ
jgi:adenylyl-sulfate kinase